MGAILARTLLLGLLLMTSTANASAPTHRILMIVRDDSRDQDLMLEQEVFVMQALIEAAGYEIDVATVNDLPLTGTQSLSPNIALGDIDLSSYDGLLLPCMAAEPQKSMPKAIVELISRAEAREMPIGAMRGSVRELARAGVLEGRRYSYASRVDLNTNPEFLNARFEGTGVTTDGRISTAGICPLASRVLGGSDGTKELTKAFLNTLPSDPSESRKNTGE